jgi:hypothetical protein
VGDEEPQCREIDEPEAAEPPSTEAPPSESNSDGGASDITTQYKPTGQQTSAWATTSGWALPSKFKIATLRSYVVRWELEPASPQ